MILSLKLCHSQHKLEVALVSNYCQRITATPSINVIGLRILEIITHVCYSGIFCINKIIYEPTLLNVVLGVR